MAQPATTKTQKVVPQEPAAVTDEEIRQRAYEIYLNRGATPGFELDDWLQAERELHSKE